MPTKEQRKKLRDALIGAFPEKSSLEQLLYFELDRNLNQITKDSNLEVIVFELIRTAETQGWFEELILAAKNSNSGNLLLQEIATELLADNPTPSTSNNKPSVNTNPPNNPPAQPVSQVFQMSNRNRYQVTNQWGGSSAPWQDAGTWVIGSRTDQQVVAIEVKSNDGGQTLNGTMTYSDEGPIGFRATRFGSNNDYKVENQWGGDAAPWNDGGIWVIGSRTNQQVVAIDVKSNDGGQTLNGTITYSGEGPISFNGQRERI
ncbi:effector-associated domain EAD1-containing protein [Scytonema hofmannii]|nr:effector-associated domain EAD1-containing protein [Scytonema hofmannii]